MKVLTRWICKDLTVVAVEMERPCSNLRTKISNSLGPTYKTAKRINQTEDM